MYSLTRFLIALFSFSFTNIAAFPVEVRHNSANSCINSTVRTIYEFPNNTWVENLAVRADGKILVTLINKPEIWLIDPINPGESLAVATIPGTAGAGGIAEIRPNLFAIAPGNWSVETFQPAPASYSVWTLDFNVASPHGPADRNTSSWQPTRAIFPIVQKVTDMSNAVFLNAITTQYHESSDINDPYSSLVFISDSVLGVVWKVDLESGAYSVAISSPLMAPNRTSAAVLGVNGIHIRDNYLYFTNSFSYLLNRIPIYRNGSAAGPAEVYATWPLADSNIGYIADDFAFDDRGNAWVAQDPSGSIVQVDVERNAELVVGGTESSLIVGDTAVNFGRTKKDRAKGTMYVTTNGGLAFKPVTGIVGGKLIAVDTQCDA
jgi:hypothetical protein